MITLSVRCSILNIEYEANLALIIRNKVGENMGKKQKKVTKQKEYTSANSESNTTSGSSLKDLLSGDVLEKLKAQSNALVQADQDRKDKEAAVKAEQQRLEQKRLENDFDYLLNNSDTNWSKYK